MKKTIKIIDLLVKVANGEKVPKVIKYRNKIYRYVFKNTITGDYDYQGSDDYLLECMSQQLYLSNVLNDEVEIIEKDKKIEKLTFDDTDVCCVDGLMKQSLNIKKTINEIIDAINELKKGE